MWGSIKVVPGVFDWDDYDRQMELACHEWITDRLEMASKMA